MRSIKGINSSSYGSFSQTGPISAAGLNKLGLGIDQTRTMHSNDINFQSNSSGTAYSTPGEIYEMAADAPWTPYDNGDDTFSIVPATINSLIPCIGDTGVENFVTYQGEIKPSETYTWSDGDHGISYIYLQSGVGSGTPPLWPEVNPSEANYPTVYSFDTAQTDDDTYGFMLIALAQKETAESGVSFNQFIFNSLWSERHKYSQPDSALYYYYRV